MKFCPHCSKEFTLEKSHCSECGRPLIMLPQREDDSTSFFDTDFDFINYSGSLFSENTQKVIDDTHLSHSESFFDLEEIETKLPPKTTENVAETNDQNFLNKFDPSDTIASLQLLQEDLNDEMEMELNKELEKKESLVIEVAEPIATDSLESQEIKDEALFNDAAVDLENNDELDASDDFSEPSLENIKGVEESSADIIIEQVDKLEESITSDLVDSEKIAIKNEEADFSPEEAEKIKLSIEDELTKILVEADELIEANIKMTTKQFDDFEITRYEIEEEQPESTVEKSETISTNDVKLNENTFDTTVEDSQAKINEEHTEDAPMEVFADFEEPIEVVEEASIEDELTKILVEVDELIEANIKTTTTQLDDFEIADYEIEEEQTESTVENSETISTNDVKLNENTFDTTAEDSQAKVDEEHTEDVPTKAFSDFEEPVEVVEEASIEEELTKILVEVDELTEANIKTTTKQFDDFEITHYEIEEEQPESTVENSETISTNDVKLNENTFDTIAEDSQVIVDEEHTEDAPTKAFFDFEEPVEVVEEASIEEEVTEVLVEADELTDANIKTTTTQLDDFEITRFETEEEQPESTVENSETISTNDVKLNENTFDTTVEDSQVIVDEEHSEDAPTEISADFEEPVEVVEEASIEEEQPESTVEKAVPNLKEDIEDIAPLLETQLETPEIDSTDSLDNEYPEPISTEVETVIETDLDGTEEIPEKTEQLVEELETSEDEPSGFDNLDWRSEKYDPRNSPVEPEVIQPKVQVVQKNKEDIEEETPTPLAEKSEISSEIQDEQPSKKAAKEESNTEDTDDLAADNIDIFGIERLPFYKVLSIILAVFIFVLLGLLCLLFLKSSLPIKFGALLVVGAISLIFYYTLKLALMHFENSARTAQELTALRQMLENDQRTNLKGGFSKK